jgi:leucyl-tRNA synthetase
MVPHLGEEIWERAGGTGTLFRHPWPAWDEAAAAEDTVSIAVQVNGKLRGEVRMARGAAREEAHAAALADERVARHLEGKTVRRVVFVQDRLLNLVVS